MYNNTVKYFIHYWQMWLKNWILAMVASSAILNWWMQCEKSDSPKYVSEQTDKIELYKDIVLDGTKEEIFICLETDNDSSYTHTKALEKITNPENVILEYPISQIFGKYKNKKSEKTHPLNVSWLAKNFGSLLGRGGVEKYNLNLPQKLKNRQDSITTQTRYEAWDTLRFSLINPQLNEYFHKYLSQQLTEDGFNDFSDIDSLKIDEIRQSSAPNITFSNSDFLLNLEDQKQDFVKKSEFIYDIVVKRLPDGKSALALYRDWEIFMTTYASVWTAWNKTRTWQYEILDKIPYKRSSKYDNSPMPFGLQYSWWFFFHQWNVTWKPASHWCVRLPWVYSSVLYSLVHNKERVDVFIDKNLYKKSEK